MFKPIPKPIRDKILHSIKHEGLSVSDAGRKYTVSPKTIYTWLRKEVEHNISILEHNRIKRENEALKKLVGELMLNQEKLKKNKYHS